MMLKQQGPSVINIIMFKLKQNNMEQEEGTGWTPASGQTILSLSWLPRRALIFYGQGTLLHNWQSSPKSFMCLPRPLGCVASTTWVQRKGRRQRWSGTVWLHLDLTFTEGWNFPRQCADGHRFPERQGREGTGGSSLTDARMRSHVRRASDRVRGKCVLRAFLGNYMTFRQWAKCCWKYGKIKRKGMFLKIPSIFLFLSRENPQSTSFSDFLASSSPHGDGQSPAS